MNLEHHIGPCECDDHVIPLAENKAALADANGKPADNEQREDFSPFCKHVSASMLLIRNGRNDECGGAEDGRVKADADMKNGESEASNET